MKLLGVAIHVLRLAAARQASHRARHRLDFIRRELDFYCLGLSVSTTCASTQNMSTFS
jgi:hypothetical protein